MARQTDTVPALLLIPGLPPEAIDLATSCMGDCIHQYVGGYFECVTAEIAGTEVDLWCNEESKLIGMAPNWFATSLWHGRMYDTLAGPVVVTGGPDAEGNTTALPPETAQAIKDRYQGAIAH